MREWEVMDSYLEGSGEVKSGYKGVEKFRVKRGR